jgi:hypothetical protein
MLLSLLPSMMVSGQEKNSGLENVAWIAGCWQQGEGADTKLYQEQWMKPAAGAMIGMSRNVINGKLREWEFLMIKEETDGNLYYVAKPSGQPEASFKLVKSAPTESTFENPEHDFPQRIIYRHESDGSLFARIEGTVQGQQKGVDFPMKRVKCE